jgi:photosystem II stability/assembly factor-like uncharacterized protein
MKSIFLALAQVAFFSFSLSAQHIELLAHEEHSSIRGLSVVSDQVIWVSGSNGTVAKSLDSGKTWEWMTVAHYETRDFRDIEAFNDKEAIILAIAEPAVLLKTKDGGKTWYTVFEDSTKGMFLDAMDFSDRSKGIIVGDPIGGKFFMRSTEDGGESWNSTFPGAPLAGTGEACFAASGTNIVLLQNGNYWLVSGGKMSNFCNGRNKKILPLLQGRESTGANSVANWKEKNYVVTGGDFSSDQDTTGNCAISFDAGINWRKPIVPPHGYRSCVTYLSQTDLICCGTSGVDLSKDGGLHWSLLSTEGFHVCRKAKTGNGVFLAGSKGRIARLTAE